MSIRELQEALTAERAKNVELVESLSMLQRNYEQVRILSYCYTDATSHFDARTVRHAVHTPQKQLVRLPVCGLIRLVRLKI